MSECPHEENGNVRQERQRRLDNLKRLHASKKELKRYIQCDNCQTPNPQLRCSRCACTYYCGVPCQRRHWSTHKTPCLDMYMDSTVQKQADLAALMEIRNDLNKAAATASVEAALGKNTKTATIDAVKKAAVLAERSENPGLEPSEREALYQEALSFVETVLVDDPREPSLLFIKGRILTKSDPQKSVEVFELLMKVNEEIEENCEKLQHMKQKIKQLQDRGNRTQAERVKHSMRSFLASGPSFTKIGEAGPGRLMFLYTSMADAHEHAGNYRAAKRVYAKIRDDKTGVLFDPRDRQAIVSLVAGMSRCSFKVKDYEDAIENAKRGLTLSRQPVGSHKLLALPLAAIGEYSAAIEVISRGILHEISSNENKLQENWIVLNELMEQCCSAEIV